MNLLATIIVGLIAGLLASWIMKVKTSVFVDLLLGVIGSVLGEWIFTLITGRDLVSGINLRSILVAFLGSIIVIAIFRLIKK